VHLTVQNETGAALTCVLVLAHFVTLEHGPVPAGAHLSTVMQGDSTAGTLWLQRWDGRPMMIENLLCGTTGAWGETRGEVPLLPLRGPTPGRMTTVCRADGRLVCTDPVGE
jgi:hypothetical protein